MVSASALRASANLALVVELAEPLGENELLQRHLSLQQLSDRALCDTLGTLHIARTQQRVDTLLESVAQQLAGIAPDTLQTLDVHSARPLRVRVNSTRSWYAGTAGARGARMPRAW